MYRVVAVNAFGETISNQDLVFTPAASAQEFLLTALEGLYFINPDEAQLAFELSAIKGTYGVTGVAANLVVTRTMPAVEGDYVLTARDATLIAAAPITASPGAHAITGIAASLVWSFQGQQVMPVADVIDGDWVPSAGADLYAAVDDPSDVSPADVDYMRVVDPLDDEAVLELGDLQIPQAGGQVYLVVRARKV